MTKFPSTRKPKFRKVGKNSNLTLEWLTLQVRWNMSELDLEFSNMCFQPFIFTLLNIEVPWYRKITCAIIINANTHVLLLRIIDR